MAHASRKTQIRSRTARCARHLATWLGDRSGGALIFSALALPVILGAAALAFDVSSWYTTKRHIQTVADASAMAAMHVRAGGGTEVDAKAAARVHAQQRLSFLDDGKRDIDVTWNDPANPANAGVESFQVTITQRRESLFSSVFMKDSQTVVAGATAANQVLGESCVLSLDPTGNSTLSAVGGAQVSGSCGFASNSSSPTSITTAGGGMITGDQILTYGEVGAGSNIVGEVIEHFFRLDDPYADLVVPTIVVPGDCDVPGVTNIAAPGTRTLTPGVYCGNIQMEGTTVVTFDPGVYVLYDAGLRISADTVVTGTGVTFILTGSCPSCVGTVLINGLGSVTLSAPDANGQTDINYLGEFAGILFFTDPMADSGAGFTSTGSGTVVLDGAMYMPSRDVSFAGSTSSAPTGCLQIVSSSVSFAGNSDFDNTTAACEALGLIEVGQRRVRLVI